MTNRHSVDHETVSPKAAAQRSPSASKQRDRRRLQRAIQGRYGAYAPDSTPRTTHVRTDGVKAVTRRLAVKRLRAAGRQLGRWWKRYARGWKQWMEDRADSNEGEAR